MSCGVCRVWFGDCLRLSVDNANANAGYLGSHIIASAKLSGLGEVAEG